VAGQAQVEGTVKMLQCKALANPQPLFTWLHNGNVILANQTVSTLRLQSLTQAAAGEYRCLVSNYLGSELSAAANVQVIGKSDFVFFFIIER
jgi:hypothetical protein